MKVLVTGANGMMGPETVRVLARDHRLRVTDIKPASAEIRRELAGHEFQDLDVTSAEAMHKAAAGMDAIVNLAVLRHDPLLGFRVNTLGCLHLMEAAKAHGIRRVVNTGPFFAVAGPSYEDWDYGITPDAPPHPGTAVYPLTKMLGDEVCRALATEYRIHVLALLYYKLRWPKEIKFGLERTPYVTSWTDAAEAIRLALVVDVAKLPSYFETFFIMGDMPQQKFIGDKAERLLGYRPKDDLSGLWRGRL